MEIKIGNKGRITLPVRLLRTLGLREGDTLTLEAKGNAILLRPKGISVLETKGIANIGKVEIEEIEESLGKEQD